MAVPWLCQVDHSFLGLTATTHRLLWSYWRHASLACVHALLCDKLIIPQTSQTIHFVKLLVTAKIVLSISYKFIAVTANCWSLWKHFPRLSVLTRICLGVLPWLCLAVFTWLCLGVLSWLCLGVLSWPTAIRFAGWTPIKTTRNCSQRSVKCVVQSHSKASEHLRAAFSFQANGTDDSGPASTPRGNKTDARNRRKHLKSVPNELANKIMDTAVEPGYERKKDRSNTMAFLRSSSIFLRSMAFLRSSMAFLHSNRRCLQVLLLVRKRQSYAQVLCLICFLCWSPLSWEVLNCLMRVARLLPCSFDCWPPFIVSRTWT